MSLCVIHVPSPILEGIESGHQLSSHPLVPACSLPQQGQSMSADGKGGRGEGEKGRRGEMKEGEVWDGEHGRREREQEEGRRGKGRKKGKESNACSSMCQLNCT